MKIYSQLVQLVERLAVNQDVVGSSPALGAILNRGKKSIKFKILVVDNPILIFK